MRELLLDGKSQIRYKLIAALVLSKVIVEVFIQTPVLFGSFAADVRHEILWSFLATAALESFTFLAWGWALVLTGNTQRLQQWLIPALWVGVAFLLQRILFSGVNDNWQGLASAFFAGLVFVLLAELFSRVRLANKLIPLVSASFIAHYFVRVYEYNFFPESSAIEYLNAYSTLGELVVPHVLHIEIWLLELAVSMTVLTLINVSFLSFNDSDYRVFVKNLINAKAGTVPRRELLEEAEAKFPMVKKEKLVSAFAKVPDPLDVHDTALSNGILMIAVVLSAVNVALNQNDISLAWLVVAAKFLIVYYLLRPNPYVYLLIMLAGFSVIGLTIWQLKLFIQYEFYHNSIFFTQQRIIRVIGSIVILILAWRVYRYRFPNFRLFTLLRDDEGKYML